MIFLEGSDFDKKGRIGITNLLSNITTREGSHKGGWARLLKCQLINMGCFSVEILDNKHSLSEFDTIIFDLGAEYSGALNMFGGLDEKVYNRLVQIQNFDGKFFSWKHDLPDLTVLSSRRTNASTCQAFKDSDINFLHYVQTNLAECETFLHTYPTDKVLIGDSHTPSVWTPEFMIERRDGRTLEGMIKNGTLHKIVNTNFRFNGHDIKTVHVHCSSIDVRHHWCREEDPDQAAAGAVMNLVGQLHDLYDDVEVVLTHTMGIEDESRELPKTGYYKGTPFFGSWEARNRLRMIFNEVIDDYTRDCPGWSKVSFPDYFFDEAGKLKFEVMERPQSVHLSPEHYRWNLETNTQRW